MTAATKEPTTKVVDLDAQHPYVEPPATREQLFSEEILEYSEIYFEEAKYYRDRSDWGRSATSSSIQNTMTRIAKAKDPETAAAEILDSLSYQIAAIRDAVSECRRAVNRIEYKRRETEAAAEANQANNAQVISDLREKIAATQAAPKEIMKAAERFEVKPDPKA